MTDSLSKFVSAARLVWHQYSENGPGGVSNDAWQAIDETWKCLNELLMTSAETDVAKHAERLFELCKRCAKRSEGLCFVTGESGLIPRLDLHRELESALQYLAQQAE